MAFFVPPLIIGGQQLLTWLMVGTAGAIAVHQTAQHLSKQRSSTSTSTVQCCCPPCDPPVGTEMYEIHRVPPHEPHWPCPADHVHFFKQMQNPNNCQCFKKRNSRPVMCIPAGTTPSFPPGMIPLPP